jgi:hypothetical protein
MPCGAVLEVGWIPVRHTVRKDDEVSEADHVDVHVRLLPILEEDAQDELLRDELAKRGWTRQPDGSMTKPFGDAIATLQRGGRTIRLAAEGSQDVAVEATAHGNIEDESDSVRRTAIEERASKEAARKLEDAKAAARARLVRDNIDKLTRQHEKLEQEVTEVVTATTKRALERRAAELGAIESVREGRDAAGGYELTIVVKT